MNELKAQERSTLVINLFTLLKSKPGQNKHNLKILLFNKGFGNYTTSEINSVLYSYPTIFIKSEDSLPKWRISDTLQAEFENLQTRNNQPINLTYYKGHKPRAWQSEALETWIEYERRGVVEAVTGTGKTAVGIMAAADAFARGLRVLVIVPGIQLIEQWHNKMSSNLPELSVGRYGNKHKDSLYDHDILISTVQSASKYYLLPKDLSGLIIADEVHHYGASSYFRALEEGFQERLGLTATYERDDNAIEEFLSPYFKSLSRFEIEKGELIQGCGYARGLSDGILAPFQVGLLGVEFEEEEFDKYQFLDRDIKKRRNQLINNHNCPYEPFGEFMKAVTVLSDGGHNDFIGQGIARGYLKNFTDRRSLLACSNKKIDAVHQLLPLIQIASKILIFTESIESAKNVAEMLNSYGIPSSDFSSKHKTIERINLMSEFEKGMLKVLVSPRVLDEGIDVPEAELGIILAASHSKRQMIQRMGRIIRPKKDGRKATFIIVYVSNTSEDPELGTHEAFLDQMYDHAENVWQFPENLDAFDVCKWYLDGN